MGDNSRGANDTLTGGDHATNYLYGDAGGMFNNAAGGNNVLIGEARAQSTTCTAPPRTCTTARSRATTR